MSFVTLSKCSSGPEIPSRTGAPSPVRPRFHHQYTNDRIREGSGRPPSFQMIGKIRKDRKSVFKEIGLDEDDPHLSYLNEKEFGELTGLALPYTIRTSTERRQEGNSDDGRSETERQVGHGQGQDDTDSLRSPNSPSSQKPWYSRLTPGRRPKIRTASSAPPPSLAGLTRLTTIALLIAVVLPGFSYYNGREKVSLNGADAGVIHQRPKGFGPVLDSRANTQTKVCKRWSQQTALLNGTLYIYGGQAKTFAEQTTDTWNNDFLVLDLTKSWDISSPSLSGLSQPSGPPAVANGYLWNDFNDLYLYGGEFADNPYVEPAPVSLWKYSIASKTWAEYMSPRTSAGNHSDGGDVPVQRSAEGAGLSVPELGLSWYFGGHLDLSTTPGWSNQIARVYLKSLLEFTHPTYINDGVYALADGTGAGDGGAYRNITQGGLQADSGFTERADGVLVFVPGWGEKGVLIGLAGGTADTFSETLSTLDVYDIARSEWYHQQTSGTPPSVRVNPCAVIASAPDTSSFQIYLFGGQNLQPYREQVQYSDMYILSIPSFTWIKVDQSNSNPPPPRAGHTCNLRDGQIVVIGGYIGTSPACESPGIFVFNATSLTWSSRFTALPHQPDLYSENSVLANSFGYKVPDAVAAVIGGNSNGGATATTPAAGPATGGPFATGKAPVFTITAAGNTATITQWGPDATSTGGVPPDPSNPGASGSTPSDDPRRPGLIAAGIIAGLAGLLALYLGYCAWLYRRQVRAYKTHLAVANRYGGSATSGLAAFFAPHRDSSNSYTPAAAGEMEQRGRSHRRDLSTDTADSVGWGGMPPVEPKLFLDEQPTPESSGSSESRRRSSGAAGQYLARPAAGWWHGESSGSGSGSGSGVTPESRLTSGSGMSGAGVQPTSASGGSADAGAPPRRSGSGESTSSAEMLLDGQEPSFFSVVLGPRRALRVVNGLEGSVGNESE
ncbi:hypothetical protein B0H67DRAFT_553715 [Lasiosphaeris hirsuta]|uniref:Kelch repeat-containing protein n=1 Tax=Lasiosphaeris hirsuta TaxID=260670 RepID=A0AA40AFY1_9PEZI|nr:hypothetical protein B0H67DRAFT_553715 [Lasiosphaeris hirsuta]